MTETTGTRHHIRRTLSYLDERGDRQFVDERALALWPSPVVLLGEPGMGKTWILEELAASANWSFRSARAFVNHPHPDQLVSGGQGLVIDGLDELSAANEADPVYRVLGQLIAAGKPRFVLSCRAADWRGAVAHPDISREYHGTATEFRIEPFDRASAILFLSEILGPPRAEETIAYLEARGLEDLYGNPLTLSLFSEVAAAGPALPETRADLMRHACAMMWQERNDRHGGSPLNDLTQRDALQAAGLAAACLILTGAEAISFAPSGRNDDGLLMGPELRRFAGGEHVQTILGSRLFSPLPSRSGLFKPVHRSVAEYLGARWLLESVRDDQARDRTLSLLTIDEGVPASLRGLHAWLATDPRFAPLVIATDPYGVLRYGDPDGLDVDNSRHLLVALQRLQEENPYFRAEDWTRHSAKSLGQIELLNDIRSLLIAPETSVHLRTLLLNAISSQPIAAALIDDLRDIILSTHRTYHYAERDDAVKAVLSLSGSSVDWPDLLEPLIVNGDEDATRLALESMDAVGFDRFEPRQIARAVLAHLGLLDDAEGEEAEDRAIGVLYLTARHLPEGQIGHVLDALAELHPHLGPEDYRTRSELSDFTSTLIARAVTAAEPEPMQLLRWLRITPGRFGYSTDNRQAISSYVAHSDTLRRTIQHAVIFDEDDHDRLWSRMWRLSELCPTLALGTADVVFFLDQLAAAPDLTDDDLKIWRELAEYAPRTTDGKEAIFAAAEPVARGNKERAAFLKVLRKPVKLAPWEVEDRKRQRDHARRRDKAWAKHRTDFAENIDALRSGEIRWTFPVSQAYLALFSDTDRNLEPADRIGQWLGPDLQQAALEGLDAVLFRDDIPSLDDVASSYAEQRRWNFILPMIAAITERALADRSLDDIPIDVVMAVRIGLHNEHLNERVHSEKVHEAIDAVLRRDAAEYERYVRLLLEPSLAKRVQHVGGLYSFARTAADRPLAKKLAMEWLIRFPNLTDEAELELIDILADAEGFSFLRLLARERLAQTPDGSRRLRWLALGVLLDFEAVRDAMGAVVVEDRDLLWALRYRLLGSSFERRAFLEVSPTITGWIIAQFRALWPQAERPNSVSMGDQNAWDATDFIAGLINRLETDTSVEATQVLQELLDGAEDGYTVRLLYAAEQQRRARREINFAGIALDQLQATIEARPPQTTDDLLEVVRHAIARLQRELRGSDTDVMNKYWRDDGQPRLEDECTDRLIEDLDRLLSPFSVGRAPQTDMPQGKRADITYSVNNAALPIECKGQWNRDLWRAADNQLGDLYLRDWRTGGRGLYLVYWFGPDVAPSRRLRSPPDSAAKPTTPDEARALLLAHLPRARRGSIAIEVLDLSR